MGRNGLKKIPQHVKNEKNKWFGSEGLAFCPNNAKMSTIPFELYIRHFVSECNELLQLKFIKMHFTVKNRPKKQCFLIAEDRVLTIDR